MAGPTMRVELREMPVDVAAEASNIAHIFMVVYRQCAWACKRPHLEACSSLLEGPSQHAVCQSILAQLSVL